MISVFYTCSFTTRFDMLVNGGGSVTLQFQRQPFQLKIVTANVPWNRMVRMDEVVLILEGETEPVEVICADTPHDHYEMKPVALSTWEHTQLGSAPSMSFVYPESQVWVFIRILLHNEDNLTLVMQCNRFLKYYWKCTVLIKVHV